MENKKQILIDNNKLLKIIEKSIDDEVVLINTPATAVGKPW